MGRVNEWAFRTTDIMSEMTLSSMVRVNEWISRTIELMRGHLVLQIE